MREQKLQLRGVEQIVQRANEADAVGVNAAVDGKRIVLAHPDACAGLHRRSGQTLNAQRAVLLPDAGRLLMHQRAALSRLLQPETDRNIRPGLLGEKRLAVVLRLQLDGRNDLPQTARHIQFVGIIGHKYSKIRYSTKI